MVEDTAEEAKREFYEWRRYAAGFIEGELARSDGARVKVEEVLWDALERLRWDTGHHAHLTILTVARAAVEAPHLATSCSILPDPRKVEEWVRALERYDTPAAIDFNAWKAAVAVRCAAEYARTGDSRYAEIVRQLLRMRSDGVSKLLAALVEIDPQLAGEVAPTSERLRFWLSGKPA